jgi:hypothetical protein
MDGHGTHVDCLQDWGIGGVKAGSIHTSTKHGMGMTFFVVFHPLALKSKDDFLIYALQHIF